jgi:hypothetical protein
MLSLEARENPFFPSEGEKDLPYSTNLDQKIDRLKQASIVLPSHARVIKRVTIEYENLDATQESKSIELNHTIDWHLPIFISQSYIENDQNERVEKKIVKEVVSKEKNSYRNIAAIEHGKFFISGKTMKIITADKLIRNFLMAQPHRIVMDFAKETSLSTYIKNIDNSVFTKIRIGNHDGYYRVVIELDGFYKYNLTKQADGCLVTLE